MSASTLPQPLDRLTDVLRAAGEPSRLRLLSLLAEGERSVKDLTDIIGQSQPRVSRHLRLLCDAGLIERHREGAWAFYRLTDRMPERSLVDQVLVALDPDDPVIRHDRARLEQICRQNAEAATAYFRKIAEDWDRIRSLHVEDAAVEAAVLDALPGRFRHLVDLGTGTGRMLELLAGRIGRGTGIDLSQEMLHFARARLERARLTHLQLRQGDIYALPLADGSADAVIMHQVLHFLDDPAAAIAEAARLLMSDAPLVIVDFAPHAIEALRADHAHRRLGFAADQVAAWMAEAGLALAGTEVLRAGADSGSSTLDVVVWRGRQALDLTASIERRAGGRE